MLACQWRKGQIAGGPGSIPGRCSSFLGFHEESIIEARARPMAVNREKEEEEDLEEDEEEEDEENGGKQRKISTIIHRSRIKEEEEEEGDEEEGKERLRDREIC